MMRLVSLALAAAVLVAGMASAECKPGGGKPGKGPGKPPPGDHCLFESALHIRAARRLPGVLRRRHGEPHRSTSDPPLGQRLLNVLIERSRKQFAPGLPERLGPIDPPQGAVGRYALAFEHASLELR